MLRSRVHGIRIGSLLHPWRSLLLSSMQSAIFYVLLRTVVMSLLRSSLDDSDTFDAGIYILSRILRNRCTLGDHAVIATGVAAPLVLSELLRPADAVMPFDYILCPAEDGFDEVSLSSMGELTLIPEIADCLHGMMLARISWPTLGPPSSWRRPLLLLWRHRRCGLCLKSCPGQCAPPMIRC